MEVRSKRITPILIRMNVGDEENYPAEQLDSINSAIQRLQTKLVKQGLKWSAKKDESKLQIIVKRIS